MADFGTLYVGFTAEDYDALTSIDAIAAYLTGKVTKITIEGEDFYIFNGDESYLIELTEDTDIEYELRGFVYLKSTWSLAPGF